MLVNCSECGRQVSDKASSCPHCGAPIGAGGRAVCKSHLKKTVALVFALFLGELGAHNGYLGYNKKRNIELTLGIVGLLTLSIGGGFILLFLWFWAIIETLSYNTDSDGNILGW